MTFEEWHNKFVQNDPMYERISYRETYFAKAAWLASRNAALDEAAAVLRPETLANAEYFREAILALKDNK